MIQDIKREQKAIKRRMNQRPLDTYIKSERFPKVEMLVQDGTLAIIAGRNGLLSLDLSNIPDFVEELQEIYEVWG